MLRQTNYGLWVDDDGEKDENEKAIDYIVECAKSVGIEVVPGETALSICFIAEVLKKVQEPKTDVDCISRKDTIDWLKKVTATDGITFETGFKQILTDIKNMPSVQPKAKTGYWFIDERPESDREVICSNCKQSVFKYHELDFDYRPKFCPNCGSYNGGGENENNSCIQ